MESKRRTNSVSRIIPASFIFIPITFVMAFTILIIGARVLGITQPVSPDPFAPFQALMPGQSDAALKPYPCQTYDSYNGGSHRRSVCVLSSERDIFQRVDVISVNGYITGARFRPRNMRLIELIWHWGRPDKVYKFGRDYEVEWSQPVHALVQIGLRYSLQARVHKIVIMASGL